MADGGFLWLVGSILGAVDADFDYDDTSVGMIASEDGKKHDYIEPRYNHKGERNTIVITSTPYNQWREDSGRVNTQDIQQFDDPFGTEPGVGGWVW